MHGNGYSNKITSALGKGYEYDAIGLCLSGECGALCCMYFSAHSLYLPAKEEQIIKFQNHGV